MSRVRLYRFSSLFFVITIAALGLGACSKDEAPPAPETVRPVKVQTVGSLTDQQRSMPGIIRADKRVDLAFRVSGPLNKLPVDEGQEVRKNDVIAQILPRDFETAVSAAKASAIEAEQQYERYKGLYARKQVSKAQFDKARSQFDITRANLKKAQDALADTTLKAPFSGVVAKRYVDNFQEVRAKEPIISLQDLSRIEVLIDVPERLMARARTKKDEIKLEARFSVAPERSFPLSIKEIAAQADPRTQTYQVVLVMDQPKGVNILPGMTATVLVSLGHSSTAKENMSLPLSAVSGTPEESSYVWVVGDDNHLSKRTVTTGSLLSSGNIEITSGLNAGEVVAVAGVSLLRDGMEVRPVSEVSF